MADKERDAREAHVARTLANLKDFEKVGADGRLRAGDVSLDRPNRFAVRFKSG